MIRVRIKLTITEEDMSASLWLFGEISDRLSNEDPVRYSVTFGFRSNPKSDFLKKNVGDKVIKKTGKNPEILDLIDSEICDYVQWVK